jgi:hypothetical protein
MAATDDKPKKSELLRRVFEFIFGFENKRGTLVNHWIVSAAEFSLSPGEFYELLEKELSARKFPSVEISRVEFAEGGLMSDQRLYLRFMRERLAVDVCAAPFGTEYFFACRTTYIPALVRLWHIVVALAFFLAVGRLLIVPLGVTFSIIALIGLMFALVGVMRNAGSGAFADLDALLLKIPVVATIYEDWVRVDTYYRDDTRTLYLKLVPGIVQGVVDEISAAKGVKLVRQHKFPPPLLHELFLPLPPRKEETK